MWMITRAEFLYIAGRYFRIVRCLSRNSPADDISTDGSRRPATSSLLYLLPVFLYGDELKHQSLHFGIISLIWFLIRCWSDAFSSAEAVKKTFSLLLLIVKSQTEALFKGSSSKAELQKNGKNRRSGFTAHCFIQIMQKNYGVGENFENSHKF